MDAFGKEFHSWIVTESVQSVLSSLNTVSDGVFKENV